MSEENRPIAKYTLRVIENRTDNYLPAEIIKDCLLNILAMPRVDRKAEKRGIHRIHYLEQVAFENSLGLGYFVSAKYNHRPPLVDTETLDRRDNPKQMKEGEEEKTHFSIGIDNDKAHLLLEKKHGGVTIKQLTNYLNNRLRHIRGTGQRIEEEVVLSGSLLDQLRQLPRILRAEVYTSTEHLTETFSGHVPIPSEAKEYIEIAISAKRGGSIKDYVMQQLYGLFSSSNQATADPNRSITRMRIIGRTDEGALALIDTERHVQLEQIMVETDENGQVITNSIHPILQDIMRATVS